MRVIELSSKKKNTKPKAEVEAMIKNMAKEDEKMVKGMFEFVEAEGGFFEFTYKIYPGRPIQTFQFVHGEIATTRQNRVKNGADVAIG